LILSDNNDYNIGFLINLIVIASFLPVFLLTGMEGKLFSPLAWTKSFILIVDAFFAITLSPVLISFLLKGKHHKI
jgi:Cu(I)/Ag(I) efflux system membrane protein CusA/SilA